MLCVLDTTEALQKAEARGTAFVALMREGKLEGILILHLRRLHVPMLSRNALL
jgi:hypothetical protein